MDELLRRAAPYLKVLEADDTDLDALTQLGTLLYTNGQIAAGRRALLRAAEFHPGDPLARVNVGNVLLDQDDLAGARAEFESALALDPASARAHRGLGIVAARCGDEVVLRKQSRELRAFPLPVDRCVGEGTPLRLLLIASAIGGNVDLEHLIDASVFERHTLVAELYDPSMALPNVDLVFNVIGDADRCGAALDRAERIVAHLTAPIINHPVAVRATGRAQNARRLDEIPGVSAPVTLAMSRAQLLSSAATQTLKARGIEPPFLLRAAGFHTGKNMCKLEAFDDLPEALGRLPGDRFFAIAFADLPEPDGTYCKYRVMFVGDRMLPLHCAISSDWNVHYFTAGMETFAARRGRDAAFLADMSGVLGSRAMTALAGVRDTLALEYGGVDFAFDADGGIVVFEANATMVVPAPTADERFAYRNGAGNRVVTAVRELLAARARATNGGDHHASED